MPATLRRGRSAGASPHGRSSSSSSYRPAINAPPATNASPAAALDPALATVLAQPALLAALLAQLLQQAAPSAPSASALPLAVVPPPAYDVHTPPSLPPHGDGLAPTHIRHVASLDFNGDDPKRTVNDFLTQFEMFCTINRAAFPVATASPYLIGDASRWFHSVYQGRSVFDITWGEFSSAMLSSPLVDIMASQRLLDEYKMQAQRSSSIKDYITDAYKSRTPPPSRSTPSWPSTSAFPSRRLPGPRLPRRALLPTSTKPPLLKPTTPPPTPPPTCLTARSPTTSAPRSPRRTGARLALPGAPAPTAATFAMPPGPAPPRCARTLTPVPN
jgi:hypothetical protein